MSDISDEINIKKKAVEEALKRAKELRNKHCIKSDSSSYDSKKSNSSINKLNELDLQSTVSEGTKRSNRPLDFVCKCEICQSYTEKCLNLKSNNFEPLVSLREEEYVDNVYAKNIFNKIKEINRSHVLKYLKYIDCVKITVHKLVLNPDSIRIINQNVNLKNKSNNCTTVSTYFIEYNFPKRIIKTSKQIRSKVDSGIDSNSVRLCAKKLNQEDVVFKQSHVHELVNLADINLEEVNLKFKISSRFIGQKGSTVLGFSTFNCGSLYSKNLSATEDISIDSEIPLDFGYLIVTVQLGCGKLYFGKELQEAINNVAKESRVRYSSRRENEDYEEDSDISDKQSINKKQPVLNKKISNKNIKNQKKVEFDKVEKTTQTVTRPPVSYKKKVESKPVQKTETKTANHNNLKKDNFTSSTKKLPSQSNKAAKNSNITNEPKQKTENLSLLQRQGLLLYGFIFISEAQFLLSEPVNSYIVCYPFGQEDQISSRIVYKSLCPVFNLYQKIPILIDDEFLLSLKNNFMTIEFWKKNENDILIGAAKLPLHQLFTCYRYADISQQLSNNQLPVISSDWWEPIYSNTDDTVKGHVKALVALGTENQIYNLEYDRGLRDRPNNYLRYSVSSNQPLFNTNQEGFQKSSKAKVFERIDLNETYDIITADDKLLIKRKDSNIISHKCKHCEKTESEEKTSEKEYSRFSKGVNTEPLKFEVGIQVDLLNMDSENDKISKKLQKPFEKFLQQMMDRKDVISKESSTNTETKNVQDSVKQDGMFKEKEIEYKNVSENIIPPVASNSLPYFEQIEKLSSDYKNTTNLNLRRTSDLLDSLHEALNLNITDDNQKAEITKESKQDENHFKVHILIEEALHLPHRKKSRSRKNKKKNNEDVLPSHYVTFETETDSQLKITPIAFKSVSPKWDFRCEVILPSTLLTDKQKRMIFKVWRKNGSQSSQQNLQTDIIIGFAALDLNVLLAGLPSVQGWFNINDFSGKCNGQIKISIAPLESITRFSKKQTVCLLKQPEINLAPPESSHNTRCLLPLPKPSTTSIDLQEPGELLSKALKRKFQELEEINQRLRMRLANVIQEDSDSNDDFSDAFECDINMLSVEDDFETVNFDNMENRKKYKNNSLLLQLEDNTDADYTVPLKQTKSNKETRNQLFVDVTENDENSKEDEQLSETLLNVVSFDQQLVQGKQRVDELLQKISMIAGTGTYPTSQISDSYNSRYVSGCSVSQTSELQRENFVPELFEKLCSVSAKTSLSSLTIQDESDCSFDSSTVDSDVNDKLKNRVAPDGAGKNVD